jgi:uncharacterized membrane protein YuzA (DUF378 family)
MKSVVAIYDSHWTALDAVEVLKKIGYPVKQLSIIGRANMAESHILRKFKRVNKNSDAYSSVVLDSALRVLQGAGIFEVPGFGFVFGAGAVKKEIAGVVVGFAGDGIVSILTKVGLKKEKIDKYCEHIVDGRFIVVAQGNEMEVETAKNILHKSGKPLKLYIQ